MNAADRLEASLVPLSEKPLDGVIDGLSTLDAWSLWTPISTPITPPAVTWLLDETLAIWHVGSGGSRSGAAQERGRAFGVGSKVVGELASRTTVEFGQEKVFSDVAVARPDPKEIAAFLSRPMAPLDSAAALFPSQASESAISDWNVATLALLSYGCARGKAASVVAMPTR
jgi:hypothetical protein